MDTGTLTVTCSFKFVYKLTLNWILITKLGVIEYLQIYKKLVESKTKNKK